MRKSVKIGLGIVALLAAGIVIYGRIEARHCRQRDVAVRARHEQLKRAVDELPIGATRDTVVQVFASVQLPMDFGKGWRIPNTGTGSIYMEGCSPGWYCGDSVAMTVTVTFDKDWRVTSKKLSDGFNNCL